MESNKPNSSKVCKHVIIESDTFFVCIKCGVVQDEILMSNSPNYDNVFNGVDDKTNDINIENSRTFCNKLGEKIDFLKELKSRGVINDLIVKDSIFFMNKWGKSNIPFQKIHHAYSVYYSAKKNSFPLTLKEISYFFQIPVKEICKIEKFMDQTFDDSPSDYISKFCSILNLTFMDEKIIQMYLKENYKTNFRNPAHIAAAAISNVFPSINKKEISRITWTAISTIKKIAHDLQIGKFK
jgi:transcription initiation factor TFIIIB Brf1 subunit/transcription initiation factor TFIIB